MIAPASRKRAAARPPRLNQPERLTSLATAGLAADFGKRPASAPESREIVRESAKLRWVSRLD